WFLGGGVAVASTIAYNNKNNDLTPPAPGMTFSGAAPLSELAPGRMMYDMAHWRSEIKSAGGAPVTFTRFFGRYGNSPPPGYETFPLSMRPKAADLGDEFPPNRTVNFGDFYKTDFDVEYLSNPGGDPPASSRVTEDTDLNPFVDSETSTLDTLYYATGSTLVPTGPNQTNLYNVCMTRYLGGQGQVGKGQDTQQPILFTGFDIWNFARVDCQAMVDAVLHGLWGLHKDGSQISRSSLRATAAGVEPWSPASIPRKR